MKKIFFVVIFIAFLSCKNDEKKSLDYKNVNLSINERLENLLSEEKIGQMNQYNGFWNVTGPTPQDGDTAKKLLPLKKEGQKIALIGTFLRFQQSMKNKLFN